MRIIKPSYEILTDLTDGLSILKHIEKAGRICYKSETNITESSCKAFITKIIKSGHESVLEHFSLSVRFIANRGFTHCLVRHRLCAFSQESTMYCNYAGSRFGKELSFIEPDYFRPGTEPYDIWRRSMFIAEQHYMRLIELRAKPQEARGVLPIDVKTEIVATANFRQWRHMLRLRTLSHNHKIEQILYRALLTELKEKLPVIFDDITYKEKI